MTDPDEPEHRAYHHPEPDRITIRDVDSPEDGLMTVRMPISSTTEARDGEAFDAERLRGWATQINEGNVPVFLDHGLNRDVAASRYSSTGKVGMLRDASVEQRDDGTSDLVVDNVLMDPETLPSATGGLREQLARIKAQVERDIPLTASVGWVDDTGDRDLPGGSDLLESSLVGIPSDPAATQGGDAAEAMARAALGSRDDDVDPEALIEQFRAVVMGPDTHRDTMTDDTQSGDDAGDDRDGQDGISAEEFREQMLEMQRNQSETLSAIAESFRDDSGDDGDAGADGDDVDDDRSDDADTDTDGTGADDGDRAITVDGEELTAADIRDMRETLADAEPETPDDERSEDGDGADDDQRASDPKNLLR